MRDNKRFTEVQNLYTRAVNYMEHEEMADESVHSIIDDATNTLEGIEGLEELHQICVFHINRWDMEEGGTFQDWTDKGILILEDITGYLGEWIANNE